MFLVFWIEERSNEHENLSGPTIWGLQVDFARIVNFISISSDGILRVFIVSGTHLLPQKMPWLVIAALHVIFSKIYLGVEDLKFGSYHESSSI